MAHNLAIAEITSINIVTLLASQHSCLNTCLPLFVEFLTSVSPALSSVLKAQQLVDTLLANE